MWFDANGSPVPAPGRPARDLPDGEASGAASGRAAGEVVVPVTRRTDPAPPDLGLRPRLPVYPDAA